MGGNKGGFSLVVRLCVKLKLKQVSIRHSQMLGLGGCLGYCSMARGLPLNINNERTRVSLALETFPDFIYIYTLSLFSTSHFFPFEHTRLGPGTLENLMRYIQLYFPQKYKSLFFTINCTAFYLLLELTCWSVLSQDFNTVVHGFY